MVTGRKGFCQWCKREFSLDLIGRIIEHRKAGDKYRCVGSGAKPQEKSDDPRLPTRTGLREREAG